MNPNLKKLLVVVGAVLGTGAVVFTVQHGATYADLFAAGLSLDCAPVVAITVERDKSAHKQRRFQRQAYVCGDAGIIIPEWRERGAEVATVKRVVSCADAPNFCNKGPFNVRPSGEKPDCVRPMKLDGGQPDCRRLLPVNPFNLDAGTVPRWVGFIVFDAAQAVGAQCEPVECVVAGGEDGYDVL